ncbi:MAG: antibiotic biosynthesis monooxygenase [Gammaproteobacteria bacterium]|nr:antibiotic biosynthesis monooxygenase [Gammaproteobacteria bacterium]
MNIIKVKQEFLDQFVAGVRDHARNSMSEPGCVRYDVLRDIDDPQIICLYEVFKDEAAFKEHLTFDYYKAWMASSQHWRHGDNRIRRVLDYI